MIKSKQLAGLLLAFTITGSSAVFAQAPQVAQEQQQEAAVSDAQLSKFAKAFTGIQAISQNAQQEMTQVVEKEGMEIQRFNEIYQANLDPQMEVDLTEEEEQQHKNIIAEVEKLQVSVQQEMEQAIAAQGLSIEEYESIIAQLQADPALQERLRASLQQ